MIIDFHIDYSTFFGEQVAIRLKKKSSEEYVFFQTTDGKNWTLSLQLSENELIEYKYFIHTDDLKREEFGKFRLLQVPKNTAHISVKDQWRATDNTDNIFFSAAFADVIFKRPTSKNVTKSTKNKNNLVKFQLHSANLPTNYSFGIIGNQKFLGSWKQAIPLSSDNFPTWSAYFEVDTLGIDLEYKYVILEPETNEILAWEDGENRTRKFEFLSKNTSFLLLNDDYFRFPIGLGQWRGAGVAIPVFSLRSETSMGIGEFSDLKKMSDWAAATQMKVLQILPVNDTIATKTWTDSYPYAAISVFALHPLYVNIQAIGKIKDENTASLLAHKIKELNAQEKVDFEAVLDTKFYFFKILYEQEKETFFNDKNVLKFIAENGDWLPAYAAFCYLRDENKTANFNLWKEYSTFSKNVIDTICDKKFADFDKVALYYFIQYHAHTQLHEATAYARSKKVVLKGDLPIGIYRFSADAWVAPQLYNMAGQAGAPPDAYAEGGQNWGFPTYNWQVMAKDNFDWWQKRMCKLAEYFDALRIDHILGFFRIWEIPTEQVEGTLGLFNPRLPFLRQELAEAGLHGDLSRYTMPYIRSNHLDEIFGYYADFVRSEFLINYENGYFGIQEKISNQLKIRNLFTYDDKYKDLQFLEIPLMRLLGEVVLIPEPNSNGTAFNPRITVQTTRSYKELDYFKRTVIDRLYNDYFYTRHDEFWKNQAVRTLPALLNATNMLICGEDLGMIPKSVPSVMRDLNIISLEIQRMPKGNTAFGVPQNYPYMSVCSPSCHDMSTIRGWWEDDEATAQRFWNQNLLQTGKSPSHCTEGIVETIVQQHLNAPSMWAIFPIQDLVGIDANLRKKDARSEQINNPANPKHYWQFRMHVTIEQLLEEKNLIEKIKSMVTNSGR